MGAVCAKQRGEVDDALLAAIRDGDAGCVKEILANTMAKYKLAPGKYYSWAEGVSALHVASNEGHLGVLKALVEVVAPPPGESKAKEIRQFHHFLNKPNSYGQTALMLACKSGHEDIVKYLLFMGADPLVPDKVHSRTCIHYAAWNGRHQCIQTLLSDDVIVRLFNGMMGPATSAIVTDACGSARMVDMRSESGFTPLHFAVSASKGEAVKVLLAKGASLTAEVLQSAYFSVWPTLSIPLHIAAAKGNHRIVRYLLTAQMQSENSVPELRLRRDCNGRTPLEVAQHAGGSQNRARLEFMLDPLNPLARALSAHSQREAAAEGVAPLVVLASCKVQEMLLNELDLLAWQLRLRDGADAAMPRNLKRHLLKNSKSRARLEMELNGEEGYLAPRIIGYPNFIQSDEDQRPSDDLDMPTTPDILNAQSEGTTDQTSPDTKPILGQGEELIPLERLLSQVGLGEKEEEEAGPDLLKTCNSRECGICLDRSPQLRIGDCNHECCHKCAAMFIKKAKSTKGPIRCPFCRGLILSFSLLENP